MNRTIDRRGQTRIAVDRKVVWSVVGSTVRRVDRLYDVSVSGARIATSFAANVGDELRLEVPGESGAPPAFALARVVWVDAEHGMGVWFLAFGVDTSLIASLAPAEIRAKGPPPLPVRPPALPVSRPAPQSQPAAPAPAPSPDTDTEEFAPEIEPLPVHRPGLIIGIDLGTTTTCAAYVRDGTAQIIPGRTGTNTIPSMITFDPKGQWYVGQRAADRQVLFPHRTVYGSKRLVGRTYRADLAAELQQHFAYPLGEADGQRFGVRIDDRVVSMDTVAARVLDEVRTTAEEFLKDRVEAAVITVPAYFTEVQREAVRRAAREANLVVHRIVNEPTAAAVAYGHKKRDANARVAVWDFGGGTFDFSIVDISRGRLEVIATGGDNFVGGSDFDDLLASHVLSEFQRVIGAFDPTPQQIARLREAAERAKRELSTQPDATVEILEFTQAPSRSLNVGVTRSELDALCAPLIERAVSIAKEVMRSSGIAPADVDDVLLVGGTTRIPAVQRAVETLFGRRPSKRINPDEAVALGAAILADEIGSDTASTLLDILPMSVGYGVPGLQFVPIVARNSRLPAQQQVTLDADLLGNVTLPLFQGESATVSQNEYLCSVIVEDRSLWDKGRVALRLAFDEHCVMSVEAANARTGKALPTRLDRTRSLRDVLRELGASDAPAPVPSWRPPKSLLGQALGKLFKAFGR